MDSDKLILICVILIICSIGSSMAFILTQTEETQINVISGSSLYNTENVTVQLTTENKTPIANQTVNVTLIDSDGERNTIKLITNNDGITTFELGGISTGTYTLECIYEGSNGYSKSNCTSSLEIKEEEKAIVSSSSSSTCPHGNPSVNECPTCYDIISASQWIYIDTNEYPSAAEHNQIREEAIKKRAELGI